MNKTIVIIITVLLMLNMAGIVSATPTIEVQDPAYKNSITITWSGFAEDIVLLVITRYNYPDDYLVYVPNTGTHTITDLDLDTERNYKASVVQVSQSVSTGFTVEEDPIAPIEVVKPTQFNGYTFGTSDCNRMAILSGQSNEHAAYMMDIIAWEYKYTAFEMVSYCERNGVDMTPITDGYYQWTPN